MSIEEWRGQLARERREKDRFFAGHWQSPKAYKSSAEKGQLFIPFRDATSGRETYGAGRYLDLDPAWNRTAGGKWILDFNRAYNPWCAYTEAYTCPVVPKENWLSVPVRAGEKDYRKT
jgi:uncharacterized protein (DUF1684 family)